MTTISNSTFRIMRSRWKMANEYPKEYGDFLNLLSQAGLEPVLDDDGNIITVESTLEFQGYQTQTVPKLQELIAHFQMPKMLTITWQTAHQSWKTVVTQDRVVTVIGQTYTDKEES